MDMFQILAGDACGGLGPIVGVVKGVFDLIKIGVPIVLIIMGAIDLGKAVLASDDKEIKAATSKLIKRAIAAVCDSVELEDLYNAVNQNMSPKLRDVNCKVIEKAYKTIKERV